MPTLDDFINDRATYPDDTKITLASGVETSLKDLRSGFLMDRDYRKKTMDLANERRTFQAERSEWEAARLDAEAKLVEMAKQLMVQNPGLTREEAEEAVASDPYAAKITRKLEAMEAKLAEREKKETELEQKLQWHQENYIADQHRRVLSTLKEKYPDLDEGELINFARNNYIPRLDWAAKLMRADDDMRAAEAAAEKRGMEKGFTKAKEELLQPALSPQRRVVARAPDAPKTMDEAADAALSDPEIRGLILSRGE